MATLRACGWVTTGCCSGPTTHGGPSAIHLVEMAGAQSHRAERRDQGLFALPFLDGTLDAPWQSGGVAQS